jgi:catechol 2,3-dioxygenase-like lactoylglutathione lyase family enzyme
MTMQLGAFSISLAVKDLAASRDFYEKLGFEPFGGDGEHYQIMKNGETVIGLFQGMFEQNILTFNPRWDQSGNQVNGATDIREIAQKLRADGIELMQESLDAESGPGSFAIVDPDGNPVLIDQHV